MSTTTTNYSLVKPARADRVDITVISNDLDIIDTALKVNAVTAAAQVESLFSASVKDYGAVGNGIVDDVTSIRNAIAACPTGGCLYFPPGTYKITGTITIGKALVIVGFKSTVYMTATGISGFAVTASNVEIRGLVLRGPRTPGAMVYAISERAVSPSGASAAAPISHVSIVGCEIYGWGDTGIWSWFTNYVDYRDNYIHDVGYAGVVLLSTIEGSVSGNRIFTVGPGNGPGNAYGITVSRNGTTSLATDPRSTNVMVTRNRIDGVPVWEGIDTHGAQGLTIGQNYITNCKNAIAVYGSPDGAGSGFGPINCQVVGNYVDSTLAGGTPKPGIGVVGIDTTADGIAAAISVVGNTVIGYGDGSISENANILAQRVNGLTAVGNTTLRGSPYNIAMGVDVTGFVCQGNFCEDAWSTSYTYAANIIVNGAPSSGYIGGNTFRRGAKTATHVNDYGVRCGYATSVITPGPNSDSGGVVTTPWFLATGVLRAPATHQDWAL